MGTMTHDEDFALIEPALARLHETFPGRVSFDLIGVTARRELPEWVNRVPLSISGTLSYPGFVNWLVQQPAWDIGIAPLADTAFNRSKSAIKVMDYSALGLPVVASDVAAYRGGIAGGLLVANTETAWFDALSRLVRDPALRRRMAEEARAGFAGECTLAAQAEARGAAWAAVLVSKPTRRRVAPAVAAEPPVRIAEGISAVDLARGREAAGRRANGRARVSAA